MGVRIYSRHHHVAVYVAKVRGGDPLNECLCMPGKLISPPQQMHREIGHQHAGGDVIGLVVAMQRLAEARRRYQAWKAARR